MDTYMRVLLDTTKGHTITYISSDSDFILHLSPICSFLARAFETPLNYTELHHVLVIINLALTLINVSSAVCISVCR